MNKLNGKITKSATLRGAMTRGAGGTYVEANPEGEATDTLEKLMVEDEIYEIRNVPDASSAHDGDVLTKTPNGAAWSPLPKIETIYSTQEQKIGTWIDGKPLYQKTINFGSLPNSTIKDLAHGIDNIDKIWIFSGFAYQPNGDFFNQLSLCIPANSSAGWYFGVNSTVVRCETQTNRSNYSAFIVLQYTKVGE